MNRPPKSRPRRRLGISRSGIRKIESLARALAPTREGLFLAISTKGGPTS